MGFLTSSWLPTFLVIVIALGSIGATVYYTVYQGDVEIISFEEELEETEEEVPEEYEEELENPEPLESEAASTTEDSATEETSVEEPE